MLATVKKLVKGVTELYQLFYKDEQAQKLFPFTIHYRTEGLTIYFESHWIRQLVLASNAEKIGVTSWKLQEKLRRNVGIRVPLTQESIEGDYQILSLTKNSKKHTMLAHLYHWHKDSKRAIELLWSKLGYKLPGEVKNPIYCHHFIAKREIYLDYVNNFLCPTMELVENDPEVREIMLQPSGYGTLNRDCDMRSVKAKLGMDDYPLIPFILERCAPAFFQMRGYQISYL